MKFSKGFLRMALLVVFGFAFLQGAGQAQKRGPQAPGPTPGQTLPTATPDSVGLSAVHLAHIDSIVERDIKRGLLPGAVVLVSRRGRIVWRRAYGRRAIEPKPEPMTVDTIFDIASLTKVVATATSVMILVERGRLQLADPVIRYIPEFGGAGKRNVTLEHLLIHRSGLPATNEVADYEHGNRHAFEKIFALAPVSEPGQKFLYSDLNYIVLGELIYRVSDSLLEDFAHANIFGPLGMKDTGFVPLRRFGNAIRARIAPTEKRAPPESAEKGAAGVGKPEAGWIRGEVHDPRAYRLGGIAGHSGLFATADDLAIFCQVFLNRGSMGGVRLLSPLGVERMTTGRPEPAGASDRASRGIGWDISTGFSANRGDLFPIGGFGHAGFTGTSIWIDPQSETSVVFLSNRFHPRPDVTKTAVYSLLPGRIAAIVAASITDTRSRPRKR